VLPTEGLPTVPTSTATAPAVKAPKLPAGNFSQASGNDSSAAPSAN